MAASPLGRWEPTCSRQDVTALQVENHDPHPDLYALHATQGIHPTSTLANHHKVRTTSPPRVSSARVWTWPRPPVVRSTRLLLPAGSYTRRWRASFVPPRPSEYGPGASQSGGLYSRLGRSGTLPPPPASAVAIPVEPLLTPALCRGDLGVQDLDRGLDRVVVGELGRSKLLRGFHHLTPPRGEVLPLLLSLGPAVEGLLDELGDTRGVLHLREELDTAAHGATAGTIGADERPDIPAESAAVGAGGVPVFAGVPSASDGDDRRQGGSGLDRRQCGGAHGLATSLYLDQTLDESCVSVKHPSRPNREFTNVLWRGQSAPSVVEVAGT